jgi:RNA polymerase sigma factor (sigma-70 family)
LIVASRENLLSQGGGSCEEGGVRRTDVDDVGLLLAAASGDDRAFAEFYRRWLPLVTGYHLRRTRSRELAFDLTAETFAAVVADPQRFDPDRGSPAGWLFEIAEHKRLDSARRARVESSARTRLGHEPLVLEDRDLQRVEELASLGDARRLDRLLAQLPAPQRNAVRARILDERSYAEIAGEMDCSEAVVRQRVHRGLSRLRERLKER